MMFCKSPFAGLTLLLLSHVGVVSSVRDEKEADAVQFNCDSYADLLKGTCSICLNGIEIKVGEEVSVGDTVVKGTYQQSHWKFLVAAVDHFKIGEDFTVSGLNYFIANSEKSWSLAPELTQIWKGKNPGTYLKFTECSGSLVQVSEDVDLNNGADDYDVRRKDGSIVNTVTAKIMTVGERDDAARQSKKFVAVEAIKAGDQVIARKTFTPLAGGVVVHGTSGVVQTIREGGNAWIVFEGGGEKLVKPEDFSKLKIQEMWWTTDGAGSAHVREAYGNPSAGEKVYGDTIQSMKANGQFEKAVSNGWITKDSRG